MINFFFIGVYDPSSVQPGCGGSMTLGAAAGVLKNEDLKTLDSCDILETLRIQHKTLKSAWLCV